MKTSTVAVSYNANLKSQIWADGQRDTGNRKSQFAVCGKIAKPRFVTILTVFGASAERHELALLRGK